MSDIGLYCLRFALVMALLGLGAGLHAGLTSRSDWTRVAERTVYVVFGFLSLATFALIHALISNDFQLAYVARYSARGMPLMFRLGAAWGGQEGSLLLAQSLLSGFASAFVWTRRNSSRDLMPWVVAVLLANVLSLLVLTNFVTVPFEKLPPDSVLSDGMGLNPLLQHPIMTIQPVALYAGFVGFAIPFAFAFATLMTGEVDTAWFHTAHRWTLFAWTMLGLALILSSRWAYEVLGWGRVWDWDAVEDAPLMPWLAGTAYLHWVMIQDRRDSVTTWHATLIGLTYTLCLLGTFVTAGGIRSPYSFADPDGLGWPHLSCVVLMTGPFVVAVLARRHRLARPGMLASLLSRETSFLLNNWLFMLLLLGVFIGTVWPVFSQPVGGHHVAMDPEFFTSMAGPLVLFLLFLMGAAPLLTWRRTPARDLRRQFIWPAAVAVAAGLGLAIKLGDTGGLWPLGCWTLSIFVLVTIARGCWRAVAARVGQPGETPLRAVAGLLSTRPRRYGGTVVHLGVVVVILGLSGGAFNQRIVEDLRPGQSAQLGDYRLEYLTTTAISAQNYGGSRARVALYQSGEPVRIMMPELRMYWLEGQLTLVPAIHSRLKEDLYLMLAAIEEDGSATFEIDRNPLAAWIWIGGCILMAGCFSVLWPQPKRGARWWKT